MHCNLYIQGRFLSSWAGTNQKLSYCRCTAVCFRGHEKSLRSDKSERIWCSSYLGSIFPHLWWCWMLRHHVSGLPALGGSPEQREAVQHSPSVKPRSCTTSNSLSSRPPFTVQQYLAVKIFPRLFTAPKPTQNQLAWGGHNYQIPQNLDALALDPQNDKSGHFSIHV